MRATKPVIANGEWQRCGDCRRVATFPIDGDGEWVTPVTRDPGAFHQLPDYAANIIQRLY